MNVPGMLHGVSMAVFFGPAGLLLAFFNEMPMNFPQELSQTSSTIFHECSRHVAWSFHGFFFGPAGLLLAFFNEMKFPQELPKHHPRFSMNVPCMFHRVSMDVFLLLGCRWPFQ